MNKKILIIIPFKFKELSRKRNLWYVLQNLTHFFKNENTIKISLIEQDTQAKIEQELKKDFPEIYYDFIYNPLPFNRSWAFNVSINKYKKDFNYFVFSDADVLMPKENYYKFLNLIEENKVIFKPVPALDINQKTTEFIIQNFPIFESEKIKKLNIPQSQRSFYKSAGIICATSLNILEKIGGWDERMIGWGREDDAFFQDILNFKIPYIFPEMNSYHLYHEPSSEVNSRLLERNTMFLKEHIHPRTYNLLNLSKKGDPEKYKNY
ncbi:MAG: galactosyltransferase-related protein [Candidatus Dojkabacteria bacterium]|nr:galactosyltransferase-related protein [Candidatus Dojkabacteria bacterium]